MEIRIDTKKDSTEDIQKAIAFLQTLVGQTPTHSGHTEPADVNPSMFSMFGDDTPNTSDSDTSSDQESDDETMRIIPY